MHILILILPCRVLYFNDFFFIIYFKLDNIAIVLNASYTVLYKARGMIFLFNLKRVLHTAHACN